MTVILTVLKLVVELTKDSKAMIAGFLVLLGLAGYYAAREIEVKQAAAMARFSTQEDRISTLERQNAVSLSVMQGMTQQLGRIESSVNETEKRVWQISRDVYTIKANRTENLSLKEN